jgi:hypothetical protein
MDQWETGGGFYSNLPACSIQYLRLRENPYFPNRITLMSIRSTYTLHMSKKGTIIDISAKPVDFVDMKHLYVEKKGQISTYLQNLSISST